MANKPKRSKQQTAAKAQAAPAAVLLSRVQMAEALNVRPEHFDKQYRPHIPADMVVMRGRRPFFPLAVFRSILDGGISEATRRAQVRSDADPMLGGGTSPALERYRLARAKLAERELANAEGELIEIEKVGRLIDIYSGHVRRAGEALHRQISEEAGMILDRALDTAEREMEQQFGATG